MKTIIISGSVGTGKTILAEKLAKTLGFNNINISKLIKENKLFSSYDKKKQCFVVDIKKLNKFLINLRRGFKEGCIIDGHLSHYIPKKYVDLCIITKCDLKTLEKRLKKRGYSKAKIRENLDCEIFDICLNEAKENKHKIIIVDTTKGINIQKIIKIIR